MPSERRVNVRRLRNLIEDYEYRGYGYNRDEQIIARDDLLDFLWRNKRAILKALETAEHNITIVEPQK